MEILQYRIDVRQTKVYGQDQDGYTALVPAVRFYPQGLFKWKSWWKEKEEWRDLYNYTAKACFETESGAREFIKTFRDRDEGVKNFKPRQIYIDD